MSIIVILINYFRKRITKKEQTFLNQVSFDKFMLSKDVKTKIKNKFDTLEKNLTVDHNHRNCCPKINYHPDSGNR